jgi:hypothetical protein
MRNLVIKYPKLNVGLKDNIQLAFIDRKNNQEVAPKEYSEIIGISTAISYILLFLYIYGTAYKKGGISLKNFTMSSAFQHCEKNISIVIMIMTLCLLQFLYYSQNMYSEGDYSRNSVIFFSYVIIAAWLLLFYIWPNKHVMHSIVTFFILFSTVYLSYSVYRIYEEYYLDSGIGSIKYTSSICTFIFISTLVLGIVNIYANYRYNKSRITSILKFIFCILEILCILSFCAFLVAFSLLAPLPNKNDIVCFNK